MSEFDPFALMMWGMITGIAIVIFGFSYRSFLKRNNLIS
jgi:hypothetical protein